MAPQRMIAIRPARRIAPLICLWLLMAIALPAVADFRDFAALPIDPALEAGLASIAEQTFSENPKLTRGNLSMTLIDLDRGTRASFQPEIGYHPASVVKLFFLTAVEEKLRLGKVKRTPELERAMRDMIIESSNDATAYVVDVISGTTGGPELEGRAFRKFQEKRTAVNRYFAKMGYTIEASGKTWGDGPYGRERQLLGPNREHRNRFSSEQPAALVYDIVRRQAVSKAASEEMFSLMHRELEPQRAGENQVTEFLGQGLPGGSKLWSKAGWTSEVRHDAAYVELPNGRRFIAVVLSRGDAANVATLPEISRKLVRLFTPGA